MRKGRVGEALPDDELREPYNKKLFIQIIYLQDGLKTCTVLGQTLLSCQVEGLVNHEKSIYE